MEDLWVLVVDWSLELIGAVRPRAFDVPRKDARPQDMTEYLIGTFVGEKSFSILSYF